MMAKYQKYFLHSRTHVVGLKNIDVKYSIGRFFGGDVASRLWLDGYTGIYL